MSTAVAAGYHGPRGMGEIDALTVSAAQEGRQRFLSLVADVRPDLHRYCARMTGSVADGEDIVQETLARAYYALIELTFAGEKVAAIRDFRYVPYIAVDAAIEQP